MSKVLFAALEKALAAAVVEDKLALVRNLAEDWRSARLRFEGAAGVVAEPTVRGYPPRPPLVAPQKVPRRSPHTPGGRAALFHAIVHIEWSAIDLALDHAYRFRDFPAAYYGDWIAVAAEEAMHFTLLRDHLRGYGHDYGDFAAHDGLWQLACATADDALARMALIPRLMEARGLDATPPIQSRLEKIGDIVGARLLDIVLHDEVGHVALGDRWFRVLCAQRGLEPETAFRRLIDEYGAPWPAAPMNEKARREAGFSEAELRALIDQRKLAT
ncbi:MAG: ferritin-like domain-containing protein [Rhodocyclaceae bacterium]|jgi:uncharacterized ferritin-like protein (DUF455 family)|nr:ferritin-like domain-containing protein [Rhodocyclaceae bacterium]